jgi:hypothetical protein
LTSEDALSAKMEHPVSTPGAPKRLTKARASINFFHIATLSPPSFPDMVPL